MPRGSNPKSKANLKKAYCGKGGFSTETARKAAVKSQEAQAQNRKLLDSVRQAVAEHPELIDQGALTLLKMAAHGNVKVWELLVRWFGEDPAGKLEISGANGGPLLFAWESNPEGDTDK